MKWWQDSYNQVSGDYDLGKSMSKSAKKNGGVGWDGGDFDSWTEKGQSDRTYYVKGQERSMGNLDPFNENPAMTKQDPQAFKLQEKLKQAGIDKNEAFHLAHAAGITNVNSKSDIKAIIAAKDKSNTSEKELDDVLEDFKPKRDDEVPETFKPTQRNEDNSNLEDLRDAYEENFEGDREPWQASSAMDSYTQSFDAAKEAGMDWDVGWYLRQRADDKKAGVANYIGFLQDKNALQAAEQSSSLMNTINNLALMGVKAPDYSDPRADFEYYAEQIRNAGEDD